MTCDVLVLFLILDVSSQILNALPLNSENSDTQIEEITVDESGVENVAPTSAAVTFEGPVYAKGKVNIFKNFGKGLTSCSCPRIAAPSSFLPMIPVVALLPDVPIPISIYSILQLKAVSKLSQVNKDICVAETVGLENINDQLIDKNYNGLNTESTNTFENGEADYSSEFDKTFTPSDVALKQLSSLLDNHIMEASSNEDVILTPNTDPLLLKTLDSHCDLTVEPIALTAIVGSDTNIIELPIEIDGCNSRELLGDFYRDTCVNSENNVPIAGTVGFKGLLPASGSVKIFRTF